LLDVFQLLPVIPFKLAFVSVGQRFSIPAAEARIGQATSRLRKVPWAASSQYKNAMLIIEVTDFRVLQRCSEDKQIP